MASLTPEEFLGLRIQKLEEFMQRVDAQRDGDLVFLNREFHEIKIALSNLQLQVKVVVAILSPVALGAIGFILQVIFRHK